MISRLWHGWTAPGNADAYESLLEKEISVEFSNRGIPGYHGIELFRKNHETEVEFVTLIRFDSLEDVKLFAGEDYEAAVIPEEARKLLSRYDTRCSHYEVRLDLKNQNK